MFELEKKYDDSSDEEDTVIGYDVKAKFREYANYRLQFLNDKIVNRKSSITELLPDKHKKDTQEDATEKQIEALTKQIKSLTIANRRLEYYENKKKELEDGVTHLLSFISHAAGIAVLYHPKVQERYKE